MSSKPDFSPTWASPPGETIVEVLAERNWGVAEFSRRMGQTKAQIDNLLSGKATITLATARRLAEVLGSSVEFWISRDFQYRDTVNRVRAEGADWLKALPIGDMVRFGWIKASRPDDELAECLRFFDVASVSDWHRKYAMVERLAAFRTSKAFESRPASVAAWLRQGEIEAGTILCQSWNRSAFEGSLESVRRLTRMKDPARFLPRLRRICAEAGVAVVVIRYPNGCRASGSARFLSPTKALLQFSMRHLSDDQFWFTFFHEAGHLLLHAWRDIYIDGLDTSSNSDEREADEFASQVLVPAQMRPRLLKMRLTTMEIIQFANEAGISPGIVVGQLQHAGRVGPERFNKLKRRYAWS